MRKLACLILALSLVGCATTTQTQRIDTTPDEDGETYGGIEYAE